MERSVVFILSTNYAGSHYASLLLGSHSKAVHVGEAKRLRKRSASKPGCDLCGAVERCPVLRGVSPDRVDRLFEQVFENVGPGLELIVDNSKQPRWAERFLGRTPYPLRFVHLIRDPRALVRRWSLDEGGLRKKLHERWRVMRKSPELAVPALVASQRRVYLYKWLWQNRAITRFLREHRLEHRIVTYHDLATNTASELGGLMAWLGLEFEPAQIEYWKFEHHGSTKAEYRWLEQQPARFFDTRWKEFLTPAESEAMRRHPAVTRYLAQIRVGFAEDGLVRLGS